MFRNLRSVKDVAELQMCTGCGACAYYRPEQIQMADVPSQGLRPQVEEGEAGERAARDAMAVCAGATLRSSPGPAPDGLIESLRPGWGPVLELWEGYAADPEIRFAASSGGAASALALAGLESLGMHGTLHIAPRDSAPYLNRTVLSRTRGELLAATGSRYAPASPCDGLGLVEAAPGPCVFLGKPCDVAASAMARELSERLDANLGLTVAIFCAGTPSTNGTMAMLRRMGVDDLSSVRSVRYRGLGWPGLATVTTDDGDGVKSHRETYAESWELLQRHRQWRCYVCADHTGELADISVGDPWYRDIPPDEPGRSLILLRTERGREFFRRSVAAGHLVAERVEPHILPDSQPQLLQVRGALVGRLATTRLLGAAAPSYSGFPMWRFFLSELDLKQKLQSFYGTVKRVFTKRLTRRVRESPGRARLDGS